MVVLAAVLVPCSSASGHTTTARGTSTPTLSLSGVDQNGFTATLSDSAWSFEACDGSATFPDGTSPFSGTDNGDGSAAFAYDSPVANETPTAISVNCQVSQSGVYIGTKTVWKSRRRIKAASRVWEHSRTCDIHSRYYSTLTINCLNSPAGWVKWFQPLWKGETVRRVQTLWNHLLSTTRPNGRYRVVRPTRAERRAWGRRLKGFVVVTVHVAAGRLLIVNNVSVVVRHAVKAPKYGTISANATGSYTGPPCSSVSAAYSGTDSATEIPFTTCRDETLTWTYSNNLGCSLFLNDDSQFSVLVDSSASSGSTTLPAGLHTLDIISCGDWTISAG